MGIPARSTRFKPDESIGMVDGCRLVGYGISDADFSSHGHEMNLSNVSW